MTRKFLGVTVGPDQLDDLCLAVGLVEGVEIVHVADARKTPHDSRATRRYNKRGAVVIDTAETLTTIQFRKEAA